MDFVYCAFFSIAFLCFLYHTSVHALQHYGKIRIGKGLHIGIDISMFAGWLSYFYVSFSTMTLSLSFASYGGLALLIFGFYLFIASSKQVHKRLHEGKGGLVTTGVYSKIRHPMYLGQILMLIGAPLFGDSFLTLILSPLLIVQLLVWRHLDEKELVKEFPEEHAAYRKKTWF
jgi:protein-S-isoprenylcysteine O-methyltransferase Ste14